MAKEKIEVIKDAENPILFEVLEQSIVSISRTLKKLDETRITEKLILALVKDDTGLSKNTVFIVLHSLRDLEKKYLKAKKT